MPRLFIGWPLSDETKRSVGATAQSLKPDLPRASWTRPETYHLTFAFLGDQREDDVDHLGRALVEMAGNAPPIEISLGAAGFFPDVRRPRVGWLGLEPVQPVETMAAAVRRAVSSLDLEYDEKPFHPHLTIVRPKARWGRSETERFLYAWDEKTGTPLLVDSITLFESRLGPGGATHVARATVPLRE